MPAIRWQLPHPLLLLLSGVVVAAALTWILQAGNFDRRDDPATGRRVVVAGTYHRVERSPVGLLAASVAVPRGFVAAADVIAVVLFVGGAWSVVDKLGTLPAVVALLVRRFRRRGLWAIPVISLFFAVMGALENMQEEIIPLIPVLLVLGSGLGIDPVAVVAMSAGAAMVGSAFGPTNPFQAGIALKLAQLSPMAGSGLRLLMFIVGLTLWVTWTMRYAARHRTEVVVAGVRQSDGLPLRHLFVLAIALAPMAAYVYGALRLDWGFNELAGAFLLGGLAAGVAGGWGLTATVNAYLEGAQSLVPAALLIGVARSISLVLEDGHVVDTILYRLAASLEGLPLSAAALLQIPIHAIVHLAVPSVSGQAVLTMPLFAPLSDLLGMSRQVAVLAYQVGAGLAELFWPTNGALMAVLLAGGVAYGRWIRFIVGAVLLETLVGVVAIGWLIWTQ
ncbi:MAG TPA: hypothetical protein VNZ26_23125 [Vicinamibacterales bacterium]|nr:hypothetical protein [Vicinamibacterales bacterium]